MVHPVEVQCSLSCSLVHLFHVLRECYTTAVYPSTSPLPPLPSKRPAELSFEANKRLKECHLDFYSSAGQAIDQQEDVNKSQVPHLRKMRRRPTRLSIPEPCTASGFVDGDEEKHVSEKEWEVEGCGYWLACRRGHRPVMEDGHGIIPNINGDPKQAFFGVFDGHGGRAAVDFVSEKLGKNIISSLAGQDKQEIQPEVAIKAGYLTTDKEFISQGVKSGACASTVVLKDGELHVANVGDCRVVLSRRGIAKALTSDHHAGREDERVRIESSGGYITCRNGVWRVQDSLAVTRSIGDASMKEWVISEPETKTIRLTPDCEFLVMASDGLWEKVTDQEAVDVVRKHSESMKHSCKELVELACRRANRDDITVMVVDLQHFAR
ncbi:unnamed protein product [Musa hybrid cultivar]